MACRAVVPKGGGGSRPAPGGKTILSVRISVDKCGLVVKNAALSLINHLSSLIYTYETIFIAEWRRPADSRKTDGVSRRSPEGRRRKPPGLGRRSAAERTAPDWNPALRTEPLRVSACPPQLCFVSGDWAAGLRRLRYNVQKNQNPFQTGAEKMVNASQLKLTIQSTRLGESEQLLPGLPCIIGRSPACGVFIDDPSISNRHALLTHSQEGQLMIRDLESTNGVILEGQRINQETLELPSKLILGDVSLIVSSVTPQETSFPAESEDTGGEGGLKTEGPGQTRRQLADEQPEARKPSPPPSPHRPAEDDQGSIICPHCWHRFNVEDFLYIARHHDLVGDPILGEDAQQRFLPSRFTPEGHAVDSAGLSCPEMACPRCHLRIPRTAAEMPPLFVSIVGAAASGKSYFLTSMMWELRNTLAKNFAMAFTDTDAVSNQLLNDFEETLFLNSAPDQKVALRKTELQGEMYNQARLDGMPVSLLKPFMFTITPAEHHPAYETIRQRISRTLVLYDNAGEHFEPGMDSVDNPATRHLIFSDTIFFLFDPTKDTRFRKHCSDRNDPQLSKGARVRRQEVLLTEMNNRIEKYTGKLHREKSNKALVVIVPKCDIWLDLLGYEIPREPWARDSRHRTCALDIDCIMSTSFSIRSLLEDICPELVASGDAFSDNLLFLPNSALGRSPELDENTGMLGVRPRDIKPFWSQVPMLYLFYRHGLTPVLNEEQLPPRDLVEVETAACGDVIFIDIPGRDIPLQVPKNYIGYRLRCPTTGQWFRIPHAE